VNNIGFCRSGSSGDARDALWCVTGVEDAHIFVASSDRRRVGVHLVHLKNARELVRAAADVVSRSLGVGARVCRASRLRIGYSRRRRARRTVPLRWYAKRCGWHFPARTRVAVDARNECVRRSRRSRSRPQARSPRHRSLDSLGCERDGERIRSSARHGRRGRVGLRVDTRRGE
jgi:hypothetical protein